MNEIKIYKLVFSEAGESLRIVTEHRELQFIETNHAKNRVKVVVRERDVSAFVAILGQYRVCRIIEEKPTHEDVMRQVSSVFSRSMR